MHAPLSLSASFPCPPAEFHIQHTVICGQTFRWRLDREHCWACLLPQTDPVTGEQTHTLARLWQDEDRVWYMADPENAALLHDYFRLDIDLRALTAQFAEADPHIRDAVHEFAGLRVLRQDPVECLFSFLCTAAAPLYRIRRVIAALCRTWGDPYPGGEVAGLTHFGFPALPRLAEASVAELTATGMGYRAKFVRETAARVMAEGGAAWLLSLRGASYRDAKAALVALPGVGAKIADCVCLFSLDKDEAIPVDTHIRQIAQRCYLADSPAAKSLTPTEYAKIGDCLRAQFGPMAGWAQQYLFFHDLYLKNQWAAYTALYQPFGEPTQPLKKDPRKFGPA